jgi:hypothetical protein
VSSQPQPCDYCRAPIMWLTSINGKPMPVDAHPDPQRGNILRQGDSGGMLGALAAAEARRRGVPLRTHHVLSCPRAGEWNRGAGRERVRGGR